MRKKDKITYAAIIATLVVTLGVLWFLIIDTVNSNYTATGSENVPAMNGGGSSSASYSAVKEITNSHHLTLTRTPFPYLEILQPLYLELQSLKLVIQTAATILVFMVLTQRLSLKAVRI